MTPIYLLLGLVAVVELAGVGLGLYVVLEGRRKQPPPPIDPDELAGKFAAAVAEVLPAPPPAHRLELSGPLGSVCLQTDRPLTADETSRLHARYDDYVRPPAPTDVLADLVCHRYIVTTKSEGMFGGVLVETRVLTTPGGQHLVVYSFDQCATLPQHEGDTPAEIAGRVILDSSGISYLQQVG